MQRPFRKVRRFRERIRIERQGAARNAMNEPTGAWGVVFETRAAAYPAPGTEKWANAQNAASSPTLFEVRDEARTRAIRPSDRIVWLSRDNRVMNIVSFEQPERGINIRIAAVSDQAGV